MTRHSQQFICAGSSKKLLGNSFGSWAKLLPMYQTLGTFSFYTFSEHQPAFQIPQSPKNESKIIFNTREVLRFNDSANVIFAFIMNILVLPVFMICRHNHNFPRLHFSAIYFFFVCFHLWKKLPRGLGFCPQKKNTCNSLLSSCIFHTFILLFCPN